jgi:hypothetical protein
LKSLYKIQGLIYSLTPQQQVYLIVGLGLVLQYLLNTLVYFQLFPDVAGKSLNGIVKNSSYLIPGILAVVVAIYFSGRKGLLSLARPYLVFPVNPFWWLLSVGMLVVLLWASLYLNDILYQNKFIPYALILPSLDEVKRYAPIFILVALCDELFWIGIIYPRLLVSGFSPLKASLIMGVLWGLEYMPFVFTGFFVAPGLSAHNLVLGWFAVTPIYVWLYHKTGSALLIVFFNLCMQFSYNALPVLPLASGDNSVVAMANLVTLLLGVFLWWVFPKRKVMAKEWRVE